MWYEIYAGEQHMTDVYDEQAIIKEFCSLVNDYGYDPDDIKIVQKGK